MKKLTLIVALFLLGCSSDNDFTNAKHQLESQGYTDIHNTGYNAFCCGEDDQFSTGFKALDRNGNTVQGCICSSFMKGITIRFE